RLYGVEPRERVGAAAGNGQRAQRAGALEARPEADEEPEREREIDAVAGPEPRAREDEAPAVRPPLPRGLRVQPPQRRSRRPGRLMHARVALERVGQVRAERRMRGLVVDEVALRRARQSLKVLPCTHIAGAGDTGAGPRRAPERAPGHTVDVVEQRAQAAPLIRAQARGVEHLERGVEHHRDPAGSWPKYSTSES